MLPSGLPEQIDDDEDLARFLVQGNQFNATSVKPSAFLPSPRIARHLSRVMGGNRSIGFGSSALLRLAIDRYAEQRS